MGGGRPMQVAVDGLMVVRLDELRSQSETEIFHLGLCCHTGQAVYMYGRVQCPAVVVVVAVRGFSNWRRELSCREGGEKLDVEVQYSGDHVPGSDCPGRWTPLRIRRRHVGRPDSLGSAGTEFAESSHGRRKGSTAATSVEATHDSGLEEICDSGR